MIGGTQGNKGFILITIHRNEGMCSAYQPPEQPRKAEREATGKGRWKTGTHTQTSAPRE